MEIGIGIGIDIGTGTETKRGVGIESGIWIDLGMGISSGIWVDNITNTTKLRGGAAGGAAPSCTALWQLQTAEQLGAQCRSSQSFALLRAHGSPCPTAGHPTGRGEARDPALSAQGGPSLLNQSHTQSLAGGADCFVTPLIHRIASPHCREQLKGDAAVCLWCL